MWTGISDASYLQHRRRADPHHVTSEDWRGVVEPAMKHIPAIILTVLMVAAAIYTIEAWID